MRVVGVAVPAHLLRPVVSYRNRDNYCLARVTDGLVEKRAGPGLGLVLDDVTEIDDVEGAERGQDVDGIANVNPVVDVVVKPA